MNEYYENDDKTLICKMINRNKDIIISDIICKQESCCYEQIVFFKFDDKYIYSI